MRAVFLSAITFLLGVLVGAVPSRRASGPAEADAGESRPRGPGVGRDLAAFFGSGGVGTNGPQRITPRPPDTGKATAETDSPAVEGTPSEALAGEATPIEPTPDPGPVFEENEMEAARTALALRREQARAALIEDADPSDEQLARIDAAATAFNGRLRALAEEVRPMIESGREPGRREAMEYAADALDVLLAAEDEMRGVLDDEQLADIDEGALDPMAWIDPSIIDMLEQWDEGN